MSKAILERVSSYQTIIWDWNGTLLNDARIGGEAESEIFRRYGLPPQTYEERLKNFFMPIEKYYAKMGFDFTKVSYDKVAEEWLSIYESLVVTAPLFEEVVDTLEALRALGKRQFVLSAAPEVHLHEMVKKHSIHHFFEGVYGLPDNRAESKIFRGKQLMLDHKIEDSTAVLIGDTSHDLEVGQALEINILLVGDGHHSSETLAKAHTNVLPTRF